MASSLKNKKSTIKIQPYEQIEAKKFVLELAQIAETLDGYAPQTSNIISRAKAYYDFLVQE